MKWLKSILNYALLCVAVALTAPYLFKRLPFATLALLLILVVLLMRQDLAEQQQQQQPASGLLP